MPLVKGQSYSWDQILAETGSVSGPVFYLLHQQGTHLVTAAALDIAVNPRAPYEIWAGNGDRIAEWADYLDQQTEPVHAFVRETDGLHYYRGQFRRIESTQNQHEIDIRLQQVQRGPIYKIIYLAEVVE